MRTLNRAIAAVLRVVLTAMVLILTLVILAQIFWRYVLAWPLVWSEELSLILMCWTTFLGSALLMQSREHLAIDVFVGLMPAPLARASAVLASVLITVFCIFLAYGGWVMVNRTLGSITPGLKVSVAWQYGGALVGGVLMVLSSLEALVATLTGRGEAQEA